MRKKLRLFTPIAVILMALSATMAAVTWFYDRALFTVFASMTAAVFAVALFMLRNLSRRTREVLDEVAAGVRYAMGGGFTELPTPVITLRGGTEIIWYNKLCAEHLFGGKSMLGEDIGAVFPGVDFAGSSTAEGYDLEYRDRRYTAFVAAVEIDDVLTSVVYLIDDTRGKFYTSEYQLSRPSVAVIAVDNYEELVQDYKDSERAQLMTEVEGAIERYISLHHGFVSKASRDRYFAIVEMRGVRDMLSDRFDLLDTVRALSPEGRMPPTLSVGLAGEEASLYECEQAARQALDMCLGRGGDQAAVKRGSGYEFYGGLSKAVEKRTKVKTRIVANALSELVRSAGNVVLMGHRFADLDSLGASVGMLRAAQKMGKQAHIVVDKNRNLVGPLLERLQRAGYTDGDFVGPGEAQQLMNPQTLLIILDTHVPHVLESEAVYRAAKTVVVIDHHRKLVGHIDNAVVFYHEPYASSACEMVAELMQYFPSLPVPNRAEAEAMLAGIMLDTKNFVLRTGVRTFEAAAWLRRLGADTVAVRGLFASTMESYRHKATFIAAAEIYGRYAIAATEESFPDIRIVAPQAADELTGIAGVDASFVLFVYEGAVNVSARSLGAVNVQLIMERLGGGGHQTMAAAQFPGGAVDDVRRQLIEAIDGYNEAAVSRQSDKAEKTGEKTAERTGA